MTETQKWLILRVCEIQQFLIDDRVGKRGNDRDYVKGEWG